LKTEKSIGKKVPKSTEHHPVGKRYSPEREKPFILGEEKFTLLGMGTTASHPEEVVQRKRGSWKYDEAKLQTSTSKGKSIETPLGGKKKKTCSSSSRTKGGGPSFLQGINNFGGGVIRARKKDLLAPKEKKTKPQES